MLMGMIPMLAFLDVLVVALIAPCIAAGRRPELVQIKAALSDRLDIRRLIGTNVLEQFQFTIKGAASGASLLQTRVQSAL